MTLVPKSKIVLLKPEDILLDKAKESRLQKIKKLLSTKIKILPFYFLLMAFFIYAIYLQINNKELSLTLKSKTEDLAAEIEEQNLLRQEIAKLKAYIERPKEVLADNGDQAIIKGSLISDNSEKDDPFYGPKNSENIVMIFTDLNCVLCTKFQQNIIPNLKKDFADTNKIKIILRDSPIPGKVLSEKLAMLAHCAGEQGKYWETFNLISQKAQDLTEKNLGDFIKTLADLDTKKTQNCLGSKRYLTEIKKDSANASQLKLTGVPSTFVAKLSADGTYNGVLIKGAQPYGLIKNEVNKLLGNL